jgi:Large ribosomal RNA subunit accumulation protein YceD
MPDKSHEPLRAPHDTPLAERAAGPFSHMLEVDRVPEGGLDLTISASSFERQALADFDMIPAIGRLDAEFHIARRDHGSFNVSGEVRALVTQTCVVSLEPFESAIVEAIDVDFAPSAEAEPARPTAGRPVEADLEGLDNDEPPDPIIDGKIDLGALASEFLSLGLDPYPRKPGVEFEPAEEAEKSTSPFNILKKIQNPK